MSNAALKLRQAIHARLAADATLIALLAGPRIYDEAPRAAAGPYVTFDRWQADDASTPDHHMTQHEFDLFLWAGQTSATAKNLAIAARIEGVLHDAAFEVEGHKLVFLYWLSSTSSREERTRLPRMILTFKALTEVL